MLTIRGASAVSTQEKFLSISVRRGHHPSGLNDMMRAPFHHHLAHCVTLAQTLLHD
jgi:hypothetical protein